MNYCKFIIHTPSDYCCVNFFQTSIRSTLLAIICLATTSSSTLSFSERARPLDRQANRSLGRMRSDTPSLPAPPPMCFSWASLIRSIALCSFSWIPRLHLKSLGEDGVHVLHEYGYGLQYHTEEGAAGSSGSGEAGGFFGGEDEDDLQLVTTDAAVRSPNRFGQRCVCCNYRCSCLLLWLNSRIHILVLLRVRIFHIYAKSFIFYLYLLFAHNPIFKDWRKTFLGLYYCIEYSC